jgi:hypothetical protein
MQSANFSRFADSIRHYDGNPQSADLYLASDGALSAYYAPFDALNNAARIVLVGITPGKTQAHNALVAARDQLQRGASHEAALRAAKATGAFSGGMRSNLVAMLDRIGLAQRLGFQSCGALFGGSSQVLQTASVLPFPVFVNGANYNGTPDPLKSAFLRGMVVEHFEPIVRALPDALYVPLGPVPAKVLEWLRLEGKLHSNRVLAGLPHPSGANAERIAYFLGKKARQDLSTKTDPNRLDEALNRLRNQAAAA